MEDKAASVPVIDPCSEWCDLEGCYSEHAPAGHKRACREGRCTTHEPYSVIRMWDEQDDDHDAAQCAPSVPGDSE